MKIQASYFDGKTSRRHRVELSVVDDSVVITGDAERACAMAEMRFHERISAAVRRLAFPDGAYLETTDAAGFDAVFHQLVRMDPLAIRAQRSLKTTLVACALTVALIALGYVYGLPAASKVLARTLPESAQHMIGRETLAFLDRHMLKPTALTEERRQRIVERFRELKLPSTDSPAYEILFRKSRIGPNALALPSGQIVLTDEIVELVGDDEAVMGILAHELGHLSERHLLRRLFQSSIVGLGATVLFGDVSSVVAGIPALLIDLKYSRDAECEADDYAIAMLKANGISPARMAQVFEKLGGKSLEMSPYLSSHPPLAERIRRVRQAQ